MTYFDLSSYRRRTALPAPACGAVPRLAFWMLAMSALWAVFAVYVWRRWLGRS